MTTPYHAKYLAHELTKRLSADNAEKLSQSLFNATVDLNPHQIEAALFAFRSPLARGAILADEVGLGKTIEAGLIISQLWAERKRKILCILPAALRKQWNRELVEKFFIDSLILESKSYREIQKTGLSSPFLQENKVVICSYQFARSKGAEVQAVPWDLVVVDEAHRLRNVYKKSNKIARAIRDAIGSRPKVLLTATPLQNSLMELFGLVSFIDPHVFGNEESFREQFAKRAESLTAAQNQNLRSRIGHLCQRTLRRQVIEYIRYTKRISITQDFTPTNAELQLYNAVSTYLQKPELFSLPKSQRTLITLILRKILASSSFAIAATLGTMIGRLEAMQQKATKEKVDGEVTEVVGEDYEQADELQDEWDEDDGNAVTGTDQQTLTDEEKGKLALKSIMNEVHELREYKGLAESIGSNAKGDALLVALKAGFAKAVDLGAPRKALIFTESRRTQAYLKGLLEANGYAAQIITFNGTNTDPESKRIYKEWRQRHDGQESVTGSPTADMRSALIEEFQERASIMIATESAAEGVNLQFCNLVVNYDLPWNPQRIEQRIGRCHRYGQEHDVVVINFLNRSNEADQRVFDLLDQKFKLFDGVFGASDEVLGALESGVDFEKRIAEIYQTCRTPNEIHAAFDKLQQELDEQIQSAMRDARTKLLENFDDEVHRKLRVRSEATKAHLDRYGEWLWRLVRYELADSAHFDTDGCRFTLHRLPAGVPEAGVALGSYRLISDKANESEAHLRAGHPLAEAIIAKAKHRTLGVREVVFDYDQYQGVLGLIRNLRGQTGWLRLVVVSVSALETEDHLLWCGFTDSGPILDQETCGKLFLVPAHEGAETVVPADAEQGLGERLEAEKQGVLNDAMLRNQRYFDAEMLKLDLWAEDVKDNLEREIKELGKEIELAKREARQGTDLTAKLGLHKRVKDLEKSRTNKRKTLFEAQDKIDAEKDRLIGEIEAQLQQRITMEEVFTVRWRLI